MTIPNSGDNIVGDNVAADNVAANSTVSHAGVTPTESATSSHKVDVKVPLADLQSQLEVEAIIPVFHSLIQEQRLPQLLVDVADYSHMPGEPFVLLVAHEGLFALEGGERPGLRYSQRRGVADEGGWSASVRSAVAAVLEARVEIEASGALSDDLRALLAFQNDQVEITINDRSVAPGPVQEVFVDAVRDVFAELGVETRVELVEARPQRMDDRLTLRVSWQGGPSAADLLAKASP